MVWQSTALPMDGGVLCSHEQYSGRILFYKK